MLAGFNTVAGFPTQQGSNFTTSSTYTISASGDKMGHVFQAPLTGTIDKICWHTGTVTTASTQFDIRLETVNDVSQGDGMPSGTLAGTNTNATVTIEPTTNDNQRQETTLTNSYSATRGEQLAIVVQWVSGNGQIRTSNSSAGAWNGSDAGMNYSVQGLGGTWSYLIARFWWGGPVYGAVYPLVSGQIHFDDGSGVISGPSTSTNTHHRGAKFRLPMPCRVSGVLTYPGDTSDCDLHLYDSDASTKLKTVTVNSSYRPSAFGCHYILFDADIELEANKYYRVAYECTAAQTIRYYYMNMATAAAASWPLGGDWYGTETSGTPTGEGDWTDFTGRFPVNLNLMFSALPDRVDPYFTRSSNVLLTR